MQSSFCYVFSFDNMFLTVMNYLIAFEISSCVLFTNVNLCTFVHNLAIELFLLVLR